MSNSNHLSTSQLGHSRKSSRTIPPTDDRIVHPTHFTAVALAATRWISGSTPEAENAVLVRPGVGQQVRSLVDALLNSVAASALPIHDSPTMIRDDSARFENASAAGTEAEPDEANLTIKARRQSEPPFLTVPIPLYSAATGTSGAWKEKERSYVSSAKGTIGRVLGLGASASASLNMARSVSASDGVRRLPTPNGESQPNVTMFPKLSTLSRYSPFAQPALSTPSTQVSLSSHSAVAIPHSPSMPSVTSSAPTTMELDTISGEAAPPTLSVNNPALGHGSLGEAADAPLVDRYGFLYDVRSGMKLLREARKKQERARRGGVSEIEVLDEAQLRAAAALIEEASAREEEEEREQTQVEVDAELEALREALGLPASSPTQSRSPGPRLGRLVEDQTSGSRGSPSLSSNSTTSRPSSPTPPLEPAASRPVRPASRLIRSKSLDAASTPSGGPQSMKRLLNQLTEMHDAVEKTQKEAWEVFIARRQTKLRAATSEGGPLRRDRPRQSGGLNNLLVNEDSIPAGPNETDLGWNENLVGVAQMGVAGKSGKEDWSEFKTLVRKGVPIAFRPKCVLICPAL